MYRSIPLGEVVALQRGYDLPEQQREPGHVPVYGSAGVTGYHNVARAPAPGVTIGRSGASIGVVNYVPTAFWPHNAVLFVTDFNGNNPRYIAYLLRTIDLQSLNSGSAQPSLNRNYVYNVNVRIAPPEQQRRIADILSAYDDLIENNTKRIKILEQQTGLVFGHVEAQAQPQAKQRELGDIADEAGGIIKTGPFGSQLHESDYTTEGTPVVMPKNLREGRIDTSDIARIPADILETLSHHQLSEGDIVYGRRGDIGRRAFIRQRQAGWLCGTGCLRITLPGGPLRSRYLHQYLGKPEIVSLIAGRAVGATMPNLNTSILRGIPIEVPPIRLQDEFVRIADANDELIDVLAAKNEILRKQRDLLLPRLLSGEIDVSRLRVPEG